jgi:CBS domain-containing protein
MIARDIMTRSVITVEPETSVRAIAALLVERSISAVPVVDGFMHVLGIVSEGDLLRRAEAGTERRSSWWLELLNDAPAMARAYVKSHGLTAEHVMTRRVASVGELTPVASIAELLEAKRIKRVPVVTRGKLVGIVSRSDILRVLLKAKDLPAAAGGDNAIREAIESRLAAESWSTPIYLNVVVHDGKVELWGRVESDDQLRATVILAQEVAGPNAVANHLSVGPISSYA